MQYKNRSRIQMETTYTIIQYLKDILEQAYNFLPTTFKEKFNYIYRYKLYINYKI